MHKARIITIFALILALIVGSVAFYGCDDTKKSGDAYNITFHSNGGSEVAGVEFYEGDDVSLPVPTKANFTFAGWYGNESLSGNPVFTLVGATAGDKEYWAKWAEAEYTLTYKDGNKTLNPKADWITKYKDADAADALPLPTTATKNGYAFLGWYDNAALTGEPVTELPAGSTGNKTFYAKWQAVTYEISFVTGIDGYWIDPISYTSEANSRLPEPENRDFLTFGGWYDDPEFTGYKIVQVLRGSYGDKTFYAKWIPEEFAITYVLNGGGFAEGDGHPVTYAYGETTPLVSPVKDKSSFLGWYEEEDLAGEPVRTIAAGSHGAKTFYAKWLTVDFIIDYELDGGAFESYYPQGYNEGETVELAEPVRKGYDFGGWYDNAELSGAPVTGIAGQTGNKKFYAKWTLSEYLVTLVANGGEFASGDGTFVYTIESNTVNLNAAAYKPARLGYTFGGWYNNAALSGNAVTNIAKGSTGDRTLYAKWTLTKYKVNYMLNGGSLGVQPTEVEYDVETAVRLPVNKPAREGYTFGGWFTDIALTTPAADIPVGSTGNRLIYAAWSANVYSIEYDPKGGSMPADYIKSYTYNVLGYLPVPTLAGKIFGGWYETDTDVPDAEKALGAILPGTSGDKTLRALWLDSVLPTNTVVKMEAEHTDLTGKTGPGGSGSASEGEMVSKDYPNASNGQCIPWTRGPGVSVDWKFASDRTVTNASVEIGFGSEIGDVTFNNKTTAIYVNGELYTKSWSVSVPNKTFASFTIDGVSLRTGYNVITIEVLANDLAVGFDAGGPMFDYIAVSAPAAISWKPIVWKE